MMAMDALMDLARAKGLDPYPIDTELLPEAVLVEYWINMAPNRFSHWIFGRDVERSDWHSLPLLQIIYHNPMHLFLHQAVTPLQRAAFYAAGIGHADFFKYNRYMVHPPVDPLTLFQAHAELIRGFEDTQGEPAVAALIRHAWAIRDFPELLATIGRQPALAYWETAILSALVQEWQSQLPFTRTRIVNAGWATFCQTTLLRSLPLSSREAIDWAKQAAQILAKRSPAAVGSQMFADLVHAHGWDRAEEVRQTHNDYDFVRQYLSDERLRELYGAKEGEEGQKREQILHELETLGLPQLETTVDHDVLHITHRYEGRELDLDDLKMVLQSIQALWRQPVIFSTVVDEHRISFRYAQGKLAETRYH